MLWRLSHTPRAGPVILARMHHPTQMYALSTLNMAEAQARARHARVVAECRPARRRNVLRTLLRSPAAPRPARGSRATAGA